MSDKVKNVFQVKVICVRSPLKIVNRYVRPMGHCDVVMEVGGVYYNVECVVFGDAQFQSITIKQCDDLRLILCYIQNCMMKEMK